MRRSRAPSLNRDGDMFRLDRIGMGDMEMIPEDQLQSMRAGRKLDGRLSLAAAKMLVTVIGRNAIIKYIQRFRTVRIGIDQKMVVARVVPFDASWCDTHAFQAEMDSHWRRDGRAIFQRDEE